MYSNLLILKELWNKIDALEMKYHKPVSQNASMKEWQPYLPCHYFDFISGTSTGGYTCMSLLKMFLSVFQGHRNLAWTFSAECP